MGILETIKRPFIKATETKTCKYCAHWQLPTEGKTGHGSGKGQCTAVNAFYALTEASYGCAAWASKADVK